MKRKGTVPHIEWKFRKHKIAYSERLLGKYLLFSSDESLPSAQVVKACLEKISNRKDVWKEADAFLHDLERVERVEIILDSKIC